MTTRSLHPDCSISEITLALPNGIPVLEQHGIDYCCGGSKPLADACETLQLDPTKIIEEMRVREADASGEDIVDWTTRSMTELADHIEQTHHAFVRESLGRLKTMMPRLLRAHGQKHPELQRLDEILAVFADDMEDHMVREERVLFPWLRRLESKTELQSGPPWSVKRPISCMEHDHDDAGEQLRRMRKLTNDYTPPEDACGTYREAYRVLAALEGDTHRHIHKENNILFPTGVRAEEKLDRSHPAARPAVNA